MRFPRRIGLAQVLLLVMLSWPSAGIAQNHLSGLKDACAAAGIELEDPRTESGELDACMQALEILALRARLDAWPEWVRGTVVAAISAGLALVVGVVSGFLTNRFAFRQARRKEVHELDQAVHEKRLELYPKLTGAAKPLAIYFPPNVGAVSGEAAVPEQITPDLCARMGREMSEWYFCKGGLLLSPMSRDAYFHLARALTRASMEQQLRVPIFPTDANDIYKESMKKYQQRLQIRNHEQKQSERPEEQAKSIFTEIEAWRFGDIDKPLAETGKQLCPTSVEEWKRAYRFKDYVFLQSLASSLRTELTEDIGSRRRPAG